MHELRRGPGLARAPRLVSGGDLFKESREVAKVMLHEQPLELNIDPCLRELDPRYAELNRARHGAATAWSSGPRGCGARVWSGGDCSASRVLPLRLDAGRARTGAVAVRYVGTLRVELGDRIVIASGDATSRPARRSRRYFVPASRIRLHRDYLSFHARATATTCE